MYICIYVYMYTYLQLHMYSQRWVRILQRSFCAFILMLRVQSAENLHEIHIVWGVKSQCWAEPRLPRIGVHAEPQMHWMCRHCKQDRQHRQSGIHFELNFSESSCFEVWKFALWANHSGRWMLGYTQYTQLIDTDWTCEETTTGEIF